MARKGLSPHSPDKSFQGVPANPQARIFRPGRHLIQPVVSIAPLNPIPIDATPSPKPIQWAYGVTTVPSRRDDLLKRTLASLSAGGFDSPRLFIDGCDCTTGCLAGYADFGLEVTARSTPNVRTVGNWILSMWELYIRQPNADRYALFQDDFVTYRNLRQYLEACPYPPKGYFNLYTFPTNQSIIKDPSQAGWNRSNQRGFGAVGLVMDRSAVIALLSSPILVNKLQDRSRSHRFIDLSIAEAMQKAGYTEFIHNPSLTQHTGIQSSMGNAKHPLAVSFRGEEFDAMSMLSVG